MKLNKRLVALAVTGCTSLGTFAVVSNDVAATGNQSCVNLVDKCVGEQNSTNPTRFRGFAGFSDVDSYAPFLYSNGTRIEDRINSVRVRTESSVFAGVCWYVSANQVTPSTYRNETAGWFDNSSVGLSSSQWVTSSCL